MNIPRRQHRLRRRHRLIGRATGWPSSASTSRGVVAGIAVVALLAIPTAASAAGSNWWYSTYNVAAVHASGITGAGVKVAVIDAQINPSLPVFQGTDLSVFPTSSCKGGTPTSTVASDASAHGSDVTALLIGNGTGDSAVAGIAPAAKVTFYSDADSKGEPFCIAGKLPNGQYLSNFGASIRQAVADGNRIISISQAGGVFEPGDLTVAADAIAKGVVIVAGQPNTAATADQRYPADLNGVVAVNAFAQDGTLQQPTGEPKRTAWKSTTVVAAGVDFPSVATQDPWAWAPGRALIGSSLATPLVAGMLADTLQKYPTATGNQLLQSLVRNTGTVEHPLAHSDDGVGYGAASLKRLLATDPTTYPDTNPLMDKSNGLGKPTAAQVAGAAAAMAGSTPSARASRSPSPSPHPVTGGGVAVWTIVLVVGLLLVLAVAAVVAALVVRSSRRRNGVRP